MKINTFSSTPSLTSLEEPSTPVVIALGNHVNAFYEFMLTNLT